MSPTDEILNTTADTVMAALREDVADMADDLRDELSVPVDRSTRPPTRSKPGEYPRLDTGALRGSVKESVERTGPDLIEATVSTDTPYDEILVARGRDFPAYITNRWNRQIEQRQQARLK